MSTQFTKCPKCGTQNPGNYRYCGTCGNNIGVACKKCGNTNPPASKLCSTCGTPLSVPSLPPKKVDPPSEAKEICERALEMWRKASRKTRMDEQDWIEVASQLSLSIKRCGNIPFPFAHACLATAWLQLNKNVEAEREANLSLQQDPNEFRAQWVKVMVTGEKLRILDIGIGDFVHIETKNLPGGDAADHVFSAVVGSVLGTAISIPFGLAKVGMTAANHSGFRAEIEKLMLIFKNLCNTDISIDHYLYMARTLIELGDMIKEVSLMCGRPNLYVVVANTPTDALNQQGRESEVMDIRHTAEGRAALFRS